MLTCCRSTTQQEAPVFVKQSINQEQLFGHLETLSSDEFGGRKTGSAGSRGAADYIVTKLASLNINSINENYISEFEHEKLIGKIYGQNIIGIINGTHYSDEYIVLTAHYDHIGIKGREIYNGTDDNASGVSAMLSIAENISQRPLKHSVILLFTDGEEINLLGAKAFFENHPEYANKAKFNINLDMISGDGTTKALRYIKWPKEQKFEISSNYQLSIGDENKPFKVKYGFKQLRSVSTVNSRTNWKMASDHGIFFKNNIPFIYFGVGEHRNYHTPNDNFEQANLSFFQRATEVIYHNLNVIDNAI